MGRPAKRAIFRYRNILLPTGGVGKNGMKKGKGFSLPCFPLAVYFRTSARLSIFPSSKAFTKALYFPSLYTT